MAGVFRCGLWLSLLVSCSAATASARAASLVYVKAGNVFIADADGRNAHQVTRDGNLSTPNQSAYRSPTEADDGTIVAAKGGELWHLRQNGTPIDHFIPDTGGYPLAAAISPDGTKIAYNFSEITQCTIYAYSCGYFPQPGAAVTSATGRGADPGAIQESVQDGDWIGNSALVLQSASSNVDYEVLGQAARPWFAPAVNAIPGAAFNPFPTSFPYPEQPVVSRSGADLAVVMRPNASGGNPSSHDVLEIWKLNGAPPAQPTPLCAFTALDAGGFQRPTFTPDDASVVWSDQAGIEQTSIDPSQCQGEATFDLSDPSGAWIPGASAPSFGTAANHPGTSGGGNGGHPLSSGLRAAQTVKRAALLKTGLTARVSCSATCGYGLVIGASNATARKLKLTRKKHGAVVLGLKTGTDRRGSVSVTVKLSAKAGRALRALGPGTSLGLVLELQARVPAGKTVVHDYRLIVKP
jgi:hypothetical protein